MAVGSIVLAALVLSADGAVRAQLPLCGDSDGDGAITVVDVVNTVRFILAFPSSCTLQVCDTDGDSQVNATDLQRSVDAVIAAPASACTSEVCDCSLFNRPSAVVVNEGR